LAEFCWGARLVLRRIISRMADSPSALDSGSPLGDAPLPPRFLLMPVSRTALRVAGEVGRKRAVDVGERLQSSDGPPWVGVVSSGILRALVVSSNGRQATLAYALPGAVLGVPEAISGNVVVTVEAVVRGEVFDLPLEILRARARVDPYLAMAVAEDLALLVESLIGESSALAFGDLKTRASRHLLVLAGLDPQSRLYEAKVTQAELANAIASTPDAVGRVLRKMADDGLVKLFPGRIRLLDVEQLLAVSTNL
jgi:CRP-like cAMP-binding protein